jgi:hypothetical protein
MSIVHATRRSGFTLFLVGAVGAVFFWTTDPRHGPAMHRSPEVHFDWRYWLFLLRGSPDNLIDAANQARVSTLMGIAGCVALIVVGLWLLSRRTV